MAECTGFENRRARKRTVGSNPTLSAINSLKLYSASILGHRKEIMKTAKDYLDEAHAVVARLEAKEAINHHGSESALFIDVRDSNGIAASGTIAGALRIPRGLIEFVADPQTPMHNSALAKHLDIYLVCGAGGQAALAGKTLIDMGYNSVTNVGGFADWKEAGGPTEA